MQGFFVFVLAFISFNSNATIPVPGAAVTREGLWAVFHNPAGLQNIDKFSAGTFHAYSMLVKEMSTSGAALALPVGNAGVAGIGIKKFGYALYNEMNGNINMSRNFGGKVAVGLRFGISSVEFGGEYSGYSTCSASAGALVRLTNEITAGVLLTNPKKFKSKNKFSKKDDLALVALGANWKFRYVSLSVAIEKSMSREHVVAVGFDYRISEKFSVSSGITNAVHQFYFGYSLLLGSLEITMHSGYHTLLGFSPQAALIYKKK